MDYHYRTQSGSQYGSQPPPYRPPTPSTPPSHPMYGPPSSSSSSSSMYPRVGQQGQTIAPPPYGHSSRPLPHHQTTTPSSSSSSGLGIRVTIKQEYRITPPPPLSQHLGDIRRSNFEFDFDLERKILAELEKETPNWGKLGLENHTPRAVESPSSSGSAGDSIVNKYIQSGLSREAVALAVANYGDNPTKVREFANAFTLLREMGFSSNSVAEALLQNDNDTDKALAYFLNNSS